MRLCSQAAVDFGRYPVNVYGFMRWHQRIKTKVKNNNVIWYLLNETKLCTRKSRLYADIRNLKQNIIHRKYEEICFLSLAVEKDVAIVQSTSL